MDSRTVEWLRKPARMMTVCPTLGFGRGNLQPALAVPQSVDGCTLFITELSCLKSCSAAQSLD